MVLLTRGKTPEGEDCAAHLLPPGAAEEAKSGYGMKIVAFGRGGRSVPCPQPKPRYFEFHCISHLLEGRGFLWTPDGRMEVFEAGSAVLMTPGLVHSYGGFKSDYVEDTVCFCGPLPDSLQNAGLFKAGVVKFGMERRLLPAIEEAMTPSTVSQIAACLDLQRLILGVEQERLARSPESGARARVQSMIESLKLNPEPWWSVEELPARCELGRLQFRRLFKELAGMPPKHFIERLKMQRAIEMLVGSDKPVAEIGRKLSYADPFHFSRRFKALSGISPAEYRSRMRSASRQAPQEASP